MRVIEGIRQTIHIDDEQEWAKYTAQWHTAGDITNFRRCVTICDELPPIGEVAPEPLQCHTTNTIVLKFTQKNIVVSCVEGLGEIQEHCECRKFICTRFGHMSI